RLAAIFHTVLVDDPARALTMARSMAAGYYEYSPALFDPPGFRWNGPDPERLKHDHHVWPDFHHARDLDASGRVVDFLPEAVADAFSLRGGPSEFADRCAAVLSAALAAFDYSLIHQILAPTTPIDPPPSSTAHLALCGP